MFPEKHIRDLESSEKRSRLVSHLLVSTTFLTSFLLLGPLIHEGMHILMLELKSCIYLFDLNFILPNGINASVEPLCAISPGYLLLFYSIGYLTTLSAGTVLNISGSIFREKFYSRYLVAAGTGMLLSVILTIGVEGDIQNALNVLGLSQSNSGWITLLIVLGVFAASIHGTEILLELERQE